ncbi:MAG TPA: hypothetical protein VG710_10585 [Opitutus sp.]|nr:hypothetical protein [Opitutus sp.]
MSPTITLDPPLTAPRMVRSSSLNGALVKLLDEMRGRKIAALLNHGHRGDGISLLGGGQLLASLGLKCRCFFESDDLSRMEGDVLLVYGAGPLARESRAFRRGLSTITNRFAEVVILPTSFDVDAPAVRDFSETWNRKFTVFCRELVSLDALRELRTSAKALLLGHDLAFHLDVSPWAARHGQGRAGIFRCDRDAAYDRVPRDFDAREDAALGPEREPGPLLDFISRFSEIHTDRSPAAIAAALMGRKVVFYRNRNFRNQAVYDHSLAGTTNVTFARRSAFSFVQFVRAHFRPRPHRHQFKSRYALE